MIAAFVTEPNVLHATLLVQMKGLKVKNHGYCNAIANAADGVLQLPEWVFDGRRTVAFMPNQTWAPCPACVELLKQRREPPR